MNKHFVAFVGFIIIAGIIGFHFYQRRTTDSSIISRDLSENIPSTSSDQSSQTDFTASFEIYTHGTKRIFTQSMYHNQTPYVYIENPDPRLIHIKRLGITWNDFFKTLPFSVTKDCLITGTKQTFCSSETNKLRFLLNGVENPNTLEVQIKPNDSLTVTFGD